MGQKRWRPGIRPQLTIIVLLAAVLSTVATLFVTENAVLNYVSQQASQQEVQHMKIARLVLGTDFGENVSIASDGSMVVDSPGASGNLKTDDQNAQFTFGKYKLNSDTDYVDLVQQLVGGMVSVFQCADQNGKPIIPCQRISSTFRASGNAAGTAGTGLSTSRAVDQSVFDLSATVAENMRLSASSPQPWVGVDTVDGTQYFADYTPLYNPQQQVIGVMFVGVKYNDVTAVVANTTIELVIIGTIIMVAGVILALIVASAIVGTLQRSARQVGTASERFGTIAQQQASGSTQQVWAINAINQALQSLAETATDISRRTDQLAQMGNQVLQRRTEISPTQVDSIIAYITRSVRDISVASSQQSATYQRMTGAMQAVMEVAEQVAGDSQQTTENADRLEQVVLQLNQLVGVRGRVTPAGAIEAPQAPSRASQGNLSRGGKRGTVQAMRSMGNDPVSRPGMMPEMAGSGAARLGARPASDNNMQGNSGRLSGSGSANQGMMMSGGNPRSRPSEAWMMPDARNGSQPYGEPERFGTGGRGGFGSQVNGPLVGSAPGSSGVGWNLPSLNGGPTGGWNGPSPMPEPTWNMPAGQPGQTPGGPGTNGMNGTNGNGRFNFGTPADGFGGMPPAGQAPGGEEPAPDATFPWMQRDDHQ
ncbi:MAG TPA: cache domain-containing protein [Ktedonobacterales bacterium]|nr:cache domain-containing protein [Ktedonobacterales bacterium]